MWGSKRSTKKPLARKRRLEEDNRTSMLNYAMVVLRSKESKPRDADELFGQAIGESLKSISDKRTKEFVKLKIQELIYHATPPQSNNVAGIPHQYTRFQQNAVVTSPQGGYLFTSQSASPSCVQNESEWRAQCSQ